MGDNNWIFIVLIVVVLGAMIVMQIFASKKNKKAQAEMMEKIVVGAKIMTVGGIIGTIVSINDVAGTITIRTADSCDIELIKGALRNVMESPVQEIPEQQPSEAKAEEEAEADQNQTEINNK